MNCNATFLAFLAENKQTISAYLLYLENIALGQMDD